MNVMTRDVHRLVNQRHASGLVQLPLSLSYQVGYDRQWRAVRPSSLVALYPVVWDGPDGVRAARMHWHRWRRRDAWRGQCTCCGRYEGTRYRLGRRWITVRLQLAHMNWQPDDLRPSNLQPLCETCHRAWDTAHQDAAGALTLAGESSLPLAWLQQRLAAGCDQVERYGLIRLSPAVLDLVIAFALQDGPCRVDELANRLARTAPMVVRAMGERLASGGREGVQVCMAASLTRLAMRRDAMTDEPFVSRNGSVITLALPRLHALPSVWGRHEPRSRVPAPQIPETLTL